MVIEALFFDLVETGNIAVIKKLISSGYDVNQEIEDGFTLLMLAASLGNLEIVKLLVEVGANVNKVDIYGTSPLIYAANKKNWDVFNYLAPLTNSDIKEIGLLASIFSGELEIIQALIDTGINVDRCRETGVWHKNDRTVLIIAIQEVGDLEIVKILLEAEADPNLIDEDSGTTPLISAVRGQYIEIVRLLLRAGADLNFKDSNEDTAFSLAKKIGNNKMIQLLIKAGFKEN